ncbi:hypothetical protein BC941DRAFT_241630 [Chlamydoabsidia padenii]|nr:hypothetical protein BC941DRAFT_241630 [Chlamydoabsidia padenii]
MNVFRDGINPLQSNYCYRKSKMTDKIQSLQRHVDQQEQEYNRAQRQLDELDTQSHVKKLQRAKLDQWKSKAVEQGQYRDASKWQQDIKRLDVALDEDQQTHSDFENRIHVLGTNLSTSREKLQGLLLDHRTQEQKSVETIIDLLKDSATLLDQHKNTTEIVINKELDSINDWITHYEYYKDNLHSK